MRLLTSAVVATLVLAAPAFAEENAEIMSPIHAFADGITAGDMAKAASAFTASPILIDEFSPYAWSGTSAFADWGADYAKDSATNGITEGKLTLGKVHRTLIAGDHAYVVMDGDYSFKTNGKDGVEHALLTFTVDKVTDGWRIASFTFSY